ncbi:MAG: 3-dehydroquinate synthase [Myxococcota bacterium]
MTPARRKTARARTIRVELGERSYPIHIGVDTLERAGRAISRCAPSSRAVVVTVPGVGRRYGAKLQRSLTEAGYRVCRITVPDGDASKSLRQLQGIWDQMIDFGADRNTPVIALGGGMVGDLAGFAAASYLRGVPFVQVPTTILAMADASIGGKVAINAPQGKNLIGAFYQPRLVWMDIATLRSLPSRQRAAGLAEVVKHGAIWDEAYFESLERNTKGLLDLDPRVLIPALSRSCEIKAHVVSEDETERGLRKLLNFGHTLAHAVETLAKYRGLVHGEAVSIGMRFAAERSEALELAPAGTAERVTSLCEALGLPTELPSHPRKAYLEALRVDKKMTDSRIDFVVLRGIGDAQTVSLSPREILRPTGRTTRKEPQAKGTKRVIR